MFFAHRFRAVAATDVMVTACTLGFLLLAAGPAVLQTRTVARREVCLSNLGAM